MFSYLLIAGKNRSRNSQRASADKTVRTFWCSGDRL